MVGAVRGIDPQTGYHFDDTRRYVDALGMSAEGQARSTSSTPAACTHDSARRDN